MVVCPQCHGETPDNTTFCVNCGHKMPATGGAQSTQFGMPHLRPVAAPASERVGGPATTQFGPDELAALTLAAQEVGLDRPRPPKPSLMAGLPRPPVSSAPSPLTASAGPKAPITPKPMPAFLPKVATTPGSAATSAARRTVMGMPILGASAPPAAAEPEVFVAPPASADAAILSMDSLANDLLSAPASATEAAPAPSAIGPSAHAPDPALMPTQTAPVAAAAAALTTATEGATQEPSVRVHRAPHPPHATEPTGVDVPRTNTADLVVPMKSMLPVVIGGVLFAAAIAAFFLLRG